MARRKRQRARILILLGVIGALGVGGVVAVQWRDAREAARIASSRTDGMAAHEAGRHEDAMRLLGYVVAKVPDDGESLLAIARSRRQVPEINSRHLGRAVVFAREAAQAMPGDLRPRELLMSLFTELGMLTERLDAARAILEINPEHRDAMLVEIDSLRRLGQRDDALARARAMRRAHPTDPVAVRAVLELMVEASRPEEETLAFLEAVIEAAPDDARLHVLKVRTLGQFGRLADARAAALVAASLPQPDAATLAGTVELLDLLGETGAADGLLERIGAGIDNAERAVIVAAARDWKNARPSAARVRIAAGIEDFSTASDDLLGWTAVIDDPGELAARARDYLRDRTTPTAGAWRAVLDARDAARDGRWQDAAASARRASELDPRNVIAPYLLGEAERSTGDWRAAVDRWSRLVLVEPRWLTLRLDLISALLAADQPRAAYNEASDTLRQWESTLIAAHAAGRAGVALIERDLATTAERTSILGLIDAIVTQTDGEPVGLALQTRALAATGRADAAAESLGRLLDSSQLPPREDLIPLLASCRKHGVFGADELIARAGADADAEPSVVFATAVALAESGRRAEADARFAAARTAAAGDARRAQILRRLHAVFLDRVGDPAARETLEALAAERRDDPEAQQALLAARSTWTTREPIDAAILALREAIGDESSLWKVHRARERLTFDASDRAAAEVVTLLEPVVRREPDNAAALTFLGEAYAVLKDYARASEMFGRAADTQRPAPAVTLRLVELLHLAGQRDQARTRMLAVLDRDDLSRDERRQRARLLLRLGMNAEASADLALLAESGSADDISLGAEAAERAGDIARASSMHEAVLAREDRTAHAVFAAASFIARQRGFDAGLGALDRLPADIPPDDRAMTVAAFHRALGRAADAERMFSEITGRTDRADAWLALARLRAGIGDAAGAKQALDAGLAAHPDNRDLQILQITLESTSADVSASRLSTIIDRLAEGHVARPALERFLAARTAIESRPDDPEFAATQLRQVTQEHPEFFPAWEELAMRLSGAGRADEAANVAREAAFRITESAPAAELAARALAIAGRFDEALSMAEVWRGRLTDDPYPAAVFTAALLRQLSRDGEALALLEPWRERIIREAERSSAIFEAYAELRARAGHTEDAGDLYTPLAERDPAWANRRMLLASRLASNPAAALRWVERWAPTLPDTAEAKLIIGKSYYDIGSASGDLALIRRAIEPLTAAAADPSARLGASILLGGAHEILGDLPAAERAYRAAIGINPDEAVVLNNLAYLLVRTGGSASEAVELSRRAVGLADRAGAPAGILVSYLDTLGVALARAERHGEAAEAFARAVSLDPQNADALLGLAESRLAAGESAADAVDRLRLLRSQNRLTTPEQQRRLDALLERRTPG